MDQTAGMFASKSDGPVVGGSARQHHYYYLDALRVMVVALLVVFHSGLVFAPFFYFVIANPERSMAIAVVAVGLQHPWQMPLLFFIAGMTSWHALGKRTAGEYVGERVKRLLLPFMFGFVLLVPPQVYLDHLTIGYFEGDYLSFVTLYFSDGFGIGYVTWHHLWFVLYLFVLSLLVLPLCLMLRSRRCDHLRERMATLVSAPRRVFFWRRRRSC